jgi:FtsX-like permease family protein
MYQSLGPGGCNCVISAATATRLGLIVAPGSETAPTIAFRGPSDLSGDDIAGVRDVVSGYPGASVVSAADLGSHNAAGRRDFEIAGSLLALVIIAIVVALVGAESRKDRAILSAVGAAPSTRRAFAGASASVVGLVAGTLGVLAGFIPVVVYRLAQGHGYPIVVPWGAIALAIVAVPVVAGAIGALCSREPKPLSLLQPIV